MIVPMLRCDANRLLATKRPCDSHRRANIFYDALGGEC